MGKATAFVCAIVFGITLIASGDTGDEDEYLKLGFTTEPTFIEENLTVENGNLLKNEYKSIDEDDYVEANREKISGLNPQQERDNGEGEGRNLGSNTNSRGEEESEEDRDRKGKELTDEGKLNGEFSTPYLEITTTPRIQIKHNKPRNRSICKSPPDIDGAITPRLKGRNHPLGTTITYNCPLGYVSRNSINHISVCQINPETERAEWTVPEITCSHRSCGDPGYVNNARRKGNLFTFPNKVEYVCDEGYKLRGIGSRYCQAGGDWSGRLPTCDQIFCSVPPDPNNGRVRYLSLEYGAELKYECNVGYILKKHQPRICSEDGTWSNDEPECIEAACEEPQSPKHGTVKLHGDLKVGSLATYSCDSDRKLHGATTTKCLISGKWTFDAPECLRSCKVPFIENGEMGRYETRYTRTGSYEEFKKVSRGENIDSSQTLFFRCKNDATAVENSMIVKSQIIEVTCNDGIWSRDVQCKKTQCLGQPPPSKNAIAVVGNREHGFTIYYTCIRTPSKKVLGNVTCHLGSWIGIPPRCLVRHCSTGSLSYPGLVKPPEIYFDSSEGFQINCEIGYRKTARNENITCVRGKWEIPQNPCTSEAQESSIIATTEQLQISHGGITEPRTKIESWTPRTTDATRNRECVCIYDYEDFQVNVQIGRTLLKQSDTIKLGETVSMECKYNTKRLKWENGLVFRGKAYMTCSRCMKWQKEDLPTCSRATSDAFITYNGDFKVLPGGIVDVRMGERRLYACRSSSDPPVWDFGERQNVVTNAASITEQGKSIYIAYLDILQASEQHNGEYECFLRGGHGSRVGSTSFVLQVHDGVDRSISTAVPGVTSGGTVTQSTVNVESSSHLTSNAENNGDCSCTYEYEDAFVNSYIGQKELKVGDTIRQGEKVSFGCKSTGMLLSWENGLVFYGKANMFCSTCRKWQKNDVPICKNVEISDAVISFGYDFNVLPGGIAIVQKGERNKFLCTHTLDYPVWNFGTRNGVVVSKSYIPGNGVPLFVSSLDIGPEVNEPNGEYECYVNDLYGQRLGSAFLHVRVNGSDPKTDILCPPIERASIFTLKYSNQRRINSTVTFYCKEHGKKTDGLSVMICLPNGTWCGRIPKCVDYVSCSEFPITPGLSVTYSNDLSVGSIASFECSLITKYLSGSNSSVCQINGSWSNPLPKCEEWKCSINDLVMSLPRNIEPDMSNVPGGYVTLGFEVILMCNDKTVLIGDSKATCDNEGRWKLGNLQCVSGCVLNQDPSSHLLIVPKKDFYRFGETILVSCPPGEQISSDVEKLMCLTNEWSHSIPDCVHL